MPSVSGSGVAVAVPQLQQAAASHHCNVVELEDLGADYLEELLRVSSEARSWSIN
ncbi:hypothetical protein ACP70R_001749 [Stipagrostis hirtigluma subsp. patula]